MEVFIILVVIISLMWAISGDRPEYRERRNWHRTREPVSDDEYLAMFDPPVSPEVAFGVREVLMDALGVDQDEVVPTAQLVKDLGAE